MVACPCPAPPPPACELPQAGPPAPQSPNYQYSNTMHPNQDLVTTQQLSALLGDDFRPNRDGAYFINEATDRLLVIASNDQNLSKFNGVVVDYKSEPKTIVLHPTTIKIVKDVDPRTINFHPDYKFLLPMGGTMLRVFKYGGRVYYSTTRRLNVTRKHDIPNYEQIYTELGGPSPSDLFDDDETYPYYYTFILHVPETSLVDKYENVDPIKLVGFGMLANTTTEKLPKYTNVVDRTITKEEAVAIYTGDRSVAAASSGYPEFMLVVDENGSYVKYESRDYQWRQDVRGSNSDTAHRFLDLIVKCKILSGGVFYNDEEFPSLPHVFVGPGIKPSADDADRVLCRYPIRDHVVIAAAVEVDTYDKYRYIPIRSRNVETYKEEHERATVHLNNIITATYINMRASLSPIKYAELDAMYSKLINLVSNIVMHRTHVVNPDAPAYTPVTFPNGYVPTPPTTTLLGLSNTIRNRPNDELKEVVAEWLCATDTINFFHMVKYFCSIDVRPPARPKKEEVPTHKPAKSSKHGKRPDNASYRAVNVGLVKQLSADARAPSVPGKHSPSTANRQHSPSSTHNKQHGTSSASKQHDKRSHNSSTKYSDASKSSYIGKGAW